jgi:prepilin-type N-terminal cleavage/methylation domain-containing protein
MAVKGDFSKMKNQKGFSLIELLIVVIIIMIIAAIAIPSLLRARISANESAVIGDTRTVISASAAYASANAGWFDSVLACLNHPATGCIPSYPTQAPTFLDSNVANQLGKSGYSRSYASGPVVPAAQLPAQASTTSTASFVYLSSPQSIGRTGVRGFGGDSSGVLCAASNGTAPTTKGTIELDTTAANCAIFQ